MRHGRTLMSSMKLLTVVEVETIHTTRQAILVFAAKAQATSRMLAQTSLLKRIRSGLLSQLKLNNGRARDVEELAIGRTIARKR